MRYLGGKSRLAKRLAQTILSHVEGSHTRYCEPFVGSAVVTAALVEAGLTLPVYASDASADLILMWQAIQKGWTPPSELSKDHWLWQRSQGEPSAMRGFAGFGCSWGGKFFGGYAAGDGRNYAAEASRSILKTGRSLRNVAFDWCDYSAIPLASRALIYCDPPYRGTTEYSASGRFDHDRFWATVRTWSLAGHTVLVSEYAAPPDFKPVWEQPHKTSIRPKQGNETRIETVFALAA